MQKQSIIQAFSDDFNCELTMLEDGEHFFHTEKQLNDYKKWLSNKIE